LAYWILAQCSQAQETYLYLGRTIDNVKS